MFELPHHMAHANDKAGKDTTAAELGMALATSFTTERLSEPQNHLPAETAAGKVLDSKTSSDLVLKLQNALVGKSSQLSETEKKLKDLVDEVAKLERELEISRKLLDESQVLKRLY